MKSKGKGGRRGFEPYLHDGRLHRPEEIATRARKAGLAHDAVKDSRGGRKVFPGGPTIPTAVQQPRPKGHHQYARATQKMERGNPHPLPVAL